MISFSVTFSNVLLMLLYLLPGFFMCKVKKVKPDHLSSISVILLYICGYALYVNALYGLDPSPALFAKMGLFLLFALAGETLLMLLILLILGKEKRKVFALRMLSIAAVMGNVGFFGMPVVRALFPDAPEAAVYSSMFNAALNILAWTVEHPGLDRRCFHPDRREKTHLPESRPGESLHAGCLHRHDPVPPERKELAA